MTTGINRYKADLREIFFLLFEQNKFNDFAGKAPYEGWDEQTARDVLKVAYRFACDELGPLNSTADQEGCKIVNGNLVTPKGFKEAWKKLFEAGIKQISAPAEYGGQNGPTTMYAAVEEMTSGANTAFNMYPGLAWGVAEVLLESGTAEQKKKFVEKMINGTWGGTMCLTEPGAGSDVGSAKTKAVKRPDGTYAITGTKMFITGGDHDLAENIIHLVLARIEGAPAGTKGLSLFIVPKLRINTDGSSGASNDVALASIEHKMGINASSTCLLNFGENDNCIGELVGGVENQGMPHMFRMMNSARILVGIQGLAVASAAYLNALEYAKDRKQGAHFTKFKDPNAPRVAIIEHPDVRRMLLDMKAHVEGIRSLIFKLTAHRDLNHVHKGKDDELAAYHQGQVDLLTPLVKAYASDEAFRLCAQAMQVYGGAGFLKDWPVEQYTRDAKIFSIYEGTNHIQAMDLVGRKLGQNGGANFQAFMNDVMQFVEKNKGHALLGPSVAMLQSAAEAVMQVAMGMLGWSQGDKGVLVPLTANRFLKMMSQTAIGWLLLEGSLISDQALAKLPAGHADKAFYEGRRYSGIWYARNVLSEVEQQAKIAAIEDTSPMDISNDSFATAG